MATRTQARELVVELLYAYTMGNERIFDFADELLSAKKIRNAQADFAKGLFKGILAHLQNIDSIIEANLKSWELSRLGVIDKCILRLGVYEILKGEIDAPVAINEAIEIAKILGAENTGKFVNGVLDAINKQKLGNASLDSCNSVLGMQFRTCKNFQASTDSSLVESPKIFTNTKATPQFLEFASRAKQPSLPLRFCESQNLGENQAKNAESELNSAESKKSLSLRDFAKQNRGKPPIKKIQKSQGGLPRRFCESARNDDSLLDSAESQNLNQNNSVRSTQTRPLRGAKNQIRASSSASADFLLESEKRGTPPKSEKRQLLARRGSGAGGAALFAKETRELDKPKGEGFAESSKKSTKTQNLQKKSQNRLPRFAKGKSSNNKSISKPTNRTKNIKSTNPKNLKPKGKK